MDIPVEKGTVGTGVEVESVQLMSNAGPSHKRRVHRCCSPHKHETANESDRIFMSTAVVAWWKYIYLRKNKSLPGPSGGGAFYAPRIKPHPALTSLRYAYLSSSFSEKLLPLPHHKTILISSNRAQLLLHFLHSRTKIAATSLHFRFIAKVSCPTARLPPPPPPQDLPHINIPS